MSRRTARQRAPRSTAARVTALAIAAVLGLLSLGFLAGGGVLVWADAQKDAEGYIATGSHRFATPTAALATESLDVDLGGAGRLLDPDRYGNVRLRVTPRTSKPVFVGIAPTADVSRYLRNTEHALVTDVDYDPFRADYRTRDGFTRATPPGAEPIWAASAKGAGAQTLAWDVEDGDWSIVVMNADGEPGVDAGVSVGARVPFLDGFGWAFLGGGLLLLAAAVGALVLAVTGRRSDHPARGAAPPPVPAPA